MVQPRRARVWVVAISVGVAACIAAYIYAAAPRYRTIPIEAPMAHLPSGGWWYEEFAKRTWNDELGPYFIWRAIATAYGPLYREQQDVVAYLEERLTQLGWQRGYANCRYDLPEARFLEEGEYIAFVPVGSNPDRPEPFVCIAVWPQEAQDGFNVVIQTFNPSLLLLLEEWEPEIE